VKRGRLLLTLSFRFATMSAATRFLLRLTTSNKNAYASVMTRDGVCVASASTAEKGEGAVIGGTGGVSRASVEVSKRGRR